MVLLAETYHMTDTAATLYRLGIERATPTQLAQARAALETVDAYNAQRTAAQELAESEAELYRQGESIKEATRTAAERLAAELFNLDQLLAAGAITWDTYTRAVFAAEDAFDSLKEKVPEVADEMDRFRATAAKRLEGMFADALTDPFSGSLREMAAKWSQMLHRMVSEALAAKLTEKLFGQGTVGGGWLGAMGAFFGFKAHGGSVPAGSFAIAGERGPEIVRGPATVTSTADTAAQSGGSRPIRIINAFEPSVVAGFLGSDEGEEIIMNVVRRNQPALAG